VQRRFDAAASANSSAVSVKVASSGSAFVPPVHCTSWHANRPWRVAPFEDCFGASSSPAILGSLLGTISLPAIRSVFLSRQPFNSGHQGPAHIPPQDHGLEVPLTSAPCMRSPATNQLRPVHRSVDISSERLRQS